MKLTDPDTNLFRSFWQAGYECADHLNVHGQRVDMLQITGHDQRVKEDYLLLSPFNIKTVREGIQWSKVERKPGFYDWTEVINRIEVGQKLGIQQIWDICHFGFPDDMSPLHPRFVDRFAGVSKAFAQLWRSLTDDTLIFTPINEMSFMSWLGGEVKCTVPYARHIGFQVKYELARAAIAGIDAVRSVDPNARILHTEPLINIIPASDDPFDISEAARFHDDQYQAMDMLLGRICPEMGGKPEYLDVLGVNFYYDNQWVHFGGKVVWDIPKDPRWKPLSILLEEIYRRYNRPIAISETSHLGTGRGDWILDIAQECVKAYQRGVELLGVCLYPIIDRPNWDNLETYHNAGLWDVELKHGVTPRRVLCEEYADDLLKAQKLITDYHVEPETEPEREYAEKAAAS